MIYYAYHGWDYYRKWLPQRIEIIRAARGIPPTHYVNTGWSRVYRANYLVWLNDSNAHWYR